MLQQAVGETTSGDTAVEAHTTLHLNRESLQGTQKLLSSTRDKPGWLFNAHHEIERHLLSGLVEHLTMTIPHLASPNQLLSLLTGRHQAERQQMLVQAGLLCHFVMKAEKKTEQIQVVRRETQRPQGRSIQPSLWPCQSVSPPAAIVLHEIRRSRRVIS